MPAHWDHACQLPRKSCEIKKIRWQQLQKQGLSASSASQPAFIICHCSSASMALLQAAKMKHPIASLAPLSLFAPQASSSIDATQSTALSGGGSCRGLAAPQHSCCVLRGSFAFDSSTRQLHLACAAWLEGSLPAADFGGSSRLKELSLLGFRATLWSVGGSSGCWRASLLASCSIASALQ